MMHMLTSSSGGSTSRSRDTVSGRDWQQVKAVATTPRSAGGPGHDAPVRERKQQQQHWQEAAAAAIAAAAVAALAAVAMAMASAAAATAWQPGHRVSCARALPRLASATQVRFLRSPHLCLHTWLFFTGATYCQNSTCPASRCTSCTPHTCAFIPGSSSQAPHTARGSTCPHTLVPSYLALLHRRHVLPRAQPVQQVAHVLCLGIAAEVKHELDATYNRWR